MTLHKVSAAAGNHTAALPQRKAKSMQLTGDQVALKLAEQAPCLLCNVQCISALGV